MELTETEEKLLQLFRRISLEDKDLLIHFANILGEKYDAPEIESILKYPQDAKIIQFKK